MRIRPPGHLWVAASGIRPYSAFVRKFGIMNKSVLLCACVFFPIVARADENSASKFASGAGTGAFLAAGVLLPLLRDGEAGKQRSIRTADALLSSAFVTEGLKRIVRSDRPDDAKARDGFPSQHATAAFAVAAMQAHYRPKEALFWYGGAALISASRVDLRRHRARDVVGGAAIGYFTARFELRSQRGLLLRPFVHNSGPARSAGLQFSRTF